MNRKLIHESLKNKINGIDVAKFTMDFLTEKNIRANENVPLFLGNKYLNLGLTKIDGELNARKVLFDNWAVK